MKNLWGKNTRRSFMKTAIVTTRHGAQDDRIYYKQALSLAKHMDVTMIAPDDGDDLTWENGVQYRPIPRRRSPLGRLLSLLEATIAVRREAPNFCHVHDLDLVLAFPLLKLLTRARLIYDSHEAFPQQFLVRKRIPKPLRPVVAKVVDLFEKALVSLGDQVITADDPTRDSFVRTGLPTTTVFNYPPLHIFATEPARLEKEREKYATRLPIIYQGTVSPDRGLFHMIDALKLLKQSEPRVLLRIVGLRNEVLHQQAKQRASEAGVEDCLEIVGWLPHLEMAYAMKSSLIGLVPLQPEEKYKRNIPIKVFEYMACGLPMVAADLPSISHYLRSSGAGILYDSTRPEELARCVLELLANPKGLQKMGEAGLRAVNEQWNWSKMAEVLWQVYENQGASPRRAT